MYYHPENQALYIFTSRHHLSLIPVCNNRYRELAEFVELPPDVHKFHQVAGDKLIDGNQS